MFKHNLESAFHIIFIYYIHYLRVCHLRKKELCKNAYYELQSAAFCTQRGEKDQHAYVIPSQRVRLWRNHSHILTFLCAILSQVLESQGCIHCCFSALPLVK